MSTQDKDPSLHSITAIASVRSKLHELHRHAGVACETSAESEIRDELISAMLAIVDTLSDMHSIRVQDRLQTAQTAASLEANIDHLRNDILVLCKLVRDGNGQPSILQRMVGVETILETHARMIEKTSRYANAIIASKLKTKAATTSGLVGIIITAMLSALAMIATIWGNRGN